MTHIECRKSEKDQCSSCNDSSSCLASNSSINYYDIRQRVCVSKNQATTGTNACGNGQEPTNIGCQNIDSQIQGDENSVALTSQQTFPSVTREPPSPPEPTGFTIEGTGEAITGTGEEQTFTCKPGSVLPAALQRPDVPLDLLFSAQSDGTVSGTYTLTASIPGPDVVVEGVFTDGTTDGNTFTLSGEGDSLCLPIVTPNLVTISGDCGDDVTMTYEDESAAGTFTGNVECTLIF